MFDTLYNRQHDYSDAYEKLLEFLVADHLPGMISQFDGKMGWFWEDEGLARKLTRIYSDNFDSIHSDPYDYLGDMYVEMQGQFSQGIKGQFLTPPNVCDMMARMLIQEDEDREISVLDPCVGTGRMLMAAARYAPNATLYGIDIDNRAIRTAFTNACIHKLRVRLLCADSLRHATDPRSEAGRHNWQYCNSWHSHYGELKTFVDEFRELKETKHIAKKMDLDQYKHKKAVQLNLFDAVK